VDAVAHRHSNPVEPPESEVQPEVVVLVQKLVPEEVDPDARLELELDQRRRNDADAGVVEREEVDEDARELDALGPGHEGAERVADHVLAHDVHREEDDARHPQRAFGEGQRPFAASVVVGNGAVRRRLQVFGVVFGLAVICAFAFLGLLGSLPVGRRGIFSGCFRVAPVGATGLFSTLFAFGLLSVVWPCLLLVGGRLGRRLGCGNRAPSRYDQQPRHDGGQHRAECLCEPPTDGTPDHAAKRISHARQPVFCQLPDAGGTTYQRAHRNAIRSLVAVHCRRPASLFGMRTVGAAASRLPLRNHTVGVDR